MKRLVIVVALVVVALLAAACNPIGKGPGTGTGSQLPVGGSPTCVPSPNLTNMPTC